MATSAPDTAATDSQTRIVRHGHEARGFDRVVQLQHIAQTRQLEHVPDRRLQAGDPQAPRHALGARMSAHQRPDAGAVDDRHAAQVDNQFPVTAAEQLLQVALERLRGTAADNRLLRRQYEAVSDPFRDGSHKWAVRSIYNGNG